MNSRTEALAHLVMAIIIMLVLSVVAYYIGGNFIGDSIINKTQNAVNAGTLELKFKIPTLPEWQEQYFRLVRYMGIIAGFILILWVALTHWLLRPSGSTGQGKRWLWGLFGIMLAALCVAAPYVFMYFFDTKFLIDKMSLQLLFFICYCLVGYWGGSIFVTSDTYKYTPIFADFFK